MLLIAGEISSVSPSLPLQQDSVTDITLLPREGKRCMINAQHRCQDAGTGFGSDTYVRRWTDHPFN